VISQRIKAGPVKARAGLAIINEAGHELVAHVGHPGLQHSDLGLDRLAVGLGF
jgi:hypothetical protein